MHCLDHRGVTGIVCGSIVADMIHTNTALGATIDQRLQAINDEAEIWYSTHMVSSRLPRLNRNNVQANGVSEWAEFTAMLSRQHRPGTICLSSLI